MNKTATNVIKLSERMAVNTLTLAKLLDCGRNTAVKIGEAADAKIVIGKRVLWHSHKVQLYLDALIQTNNGGSKI